MTKNSVTQKVLHGVTKSVTKPSPLRNSIVLCPFAILLPRMPAPFVLPSVEKCYSSGRVTLFDLKKVLQIEAFHCFQLLGRYYFVGRVRYFLLCY